MQDPSRPVLQTLDFYVTGAVAWVTLNRPDARNAMSDLMYDELVDVVRRTELDNAVRVMVITGAGTVFCAGGDIKGMAARVEMSTTPAAREWRYKDKTIRVVQALFSLTKPVLAVLNGPAVGGGALLALLADVRLACAEAWLSFPFLSQALLPDWGATYLLPRAVGPSLALDLLITQRRLGAEECRQIGLFSDVVPAGTLPFRAGELANTIAGLPEQALRALKQAIRNPEVGSLVTAMLKEGVEQSRLVSVRGKSQSH